MSLRPWTGVSRKICTSSKLAELPDDACRFLYASLLVVMDSHGCIDARPHIVLATAWPLLGKTVQETARCIQELERVGLLERHAEAGDEWLAMPDWDEPGKAGAMIRDRAAPQFGAEAKRRAAEKVAKRGVRRRGASDPTQDQTDGASEEPPRHLRATSEVPQHHRSGSPEVALGSSLSDLSSLRRTVQEDPSGLPPPPPSGASRDPVRERKPPQAPVTPDSPPIPEAIDSAEFREAWADWVRYRREMGSRFALKPTGAAQQLAKCAELGAARAVAALRHTMAMGWQGMREPDPDRSALTGPRSATSPETSTRAWFEAQSREAARAVDVEGRRTA